MFKCCVHMCRPEVNFRILFQSFCFWTRGHYSAGLASDSLQASGCPCLPRAGIMGAHCCAHFPYIRAGDPNSGLHSKHFHTLSLSLVLPTWPLLQTWGHVQIVLRNMVRVHQGGSVCLGPSCVLRNTVRLIKGDGYLGVRH